MFPIRDDNPHNRFPLVVLALIIGNIYVFWHEFNLSTPNLELFIKAYGLIPARDFGQELVFKNYFSSMFLHGGFFHLLANMWSLWIFGDNVEAAMGFVRFLLFYILCGVIATLVHAGLNPASAIPVVGASGAIAGVMGAYLLLFPRARIRMFTLLIFYPIFFDLPAFVFLIFWFGGQIISGAASYSLAKAGSGGDAGGIAFFAHIGGFVAGMALMPFFRVRSLRRRR